MTPPFDRFVATGSVRGREHVRLGRNNQDAVRAHHEPGLDVIVVTDGCGSSRASEVGAQLGALSIVEACVRGTKVGARGAELAGEVTECVERTLTRMARALVAGSSVDETLIDEFFLFTFLAAVAWAEGSLVFGIGDGIVIVDDETRVIDSGATNAPDYVAYRLVDRNRAPLRVHFDAPLAVPRSITLATDGASALVASSALRELSADPRLAKNPSLLQKRLVRWAAEPGVLMDDTSVAILGSNRSRVAVGGAR